MLIVNCLLLNDIYAIGDKHVRVTRWKIYVLLAMGGLLMGCTSKAPSDKDVEVALKQLWAGNSWEFSSNFDVTNFDRLNGWKDGEDYWVEVTYKVKARQPYYAIVADCVEPTVAEYNDTTMGQITMGLSAMMKGFQGTEALDEYKEYLKTNPEPAKMELARSKYEAQYVNIAFLDCVNYLAEKSSVFHKDLKTGDTLDYNLKLRFKQTEQGWKNL